jgi:hypothetical protein
MPEKKMEIQEKCRAYGRILRKCKRYSSLTYSEQVLPGQEKELEATLEEEAGLARHQALCDRNGHVREDN